MKLKLLFLLALLGNTVFAQSQQKSYVIHTVAFLQFRKLI